MFFVAFCQKIKSKEKEKLNKMEIRFRLRKKTTSYSTCDGLPQFWIILSEHNGRITHGNGDFKSNGLRWESFDYTMNKSFSWMFPTPISR
jgi:hypothetical protein